MGVLAMRIVVSIDSQLVSNLATKEAADTVRQTKIKYISSRHPNHWSEGMIYYALTIVVVVWAVEVQFGELMAFRRSCRGYHEVFQVHGNMPLWVSFEPKW